MHRELMAVQVETVLRGLRLVVLKITYFLKSFCLAQMLTLGLPIP